MTISYILLALLITIVAFGVVRAAKQPKANRRRKLPPKNIFLEVEEDTAPLTDDLEELIENNHETTTHTTYQSSTTYEIKETEAETQDAVEEEMTDYLLESTETDSYDNTEHPPETNTTTNVEIVNELITITLRAADNKPYKGYELLQALLTSGLRYSRIGVFHRYNKLINRDEVLFSLMSAVAPGTFELPKMGAFTSPALTLFMQTADVQNPAQTYNMMLATAKELTEILGGSLLDENKVPLTEQKVEDWQERLKGVVAAV